MTLSVDPQYDETLYRIVSQLIQQITEDDRSVEFEVHYETKGGVECKAPCNKVMRLA